MRCLLVSPDDFLTELLPPAAVSTLRPVYLVETDSARRRIRRRGGEALVGRLDGEAVYRKAFRSGSEVALVAMPAARLPRVVAAIRRVAPGAPILALSEEPAPPLEGVTAVPLASFAERVVVPEIERAIARARVLRVRAELARAERVLILMQDDPDPDAIASAIALRALLGRNKTAAPIATFGTITRPENRAMTQILDIDVEEITAPEAARYDTIAIVDAQPSFFEEALPDVTLVIDHHPEDVPTRARIKDIRPTWGATSTILTEYLRAAEVKLTQRLATALLYGIKADTLHLERGATKADMEAFAFLHPQANHSALRRIERLELPEDALDVLARGIGRRRTVDGALFSHLGPVGYPELVAQFADLLLQVEGIEWSVVSGSVRGELHVSVRNVGYVRAAGEVVREAFGDVGSAGGHRSMAKAVIRLDDWRARGGSTDDDMLGDAVMTRVLGALRSRA